MEAKEMTLFAPGDFMEDDDDRKARADETVIIRPAYPGAVSDQDLERFRRKFEDAQGKPAMILPAPLPTHYLPPVVPWNGFDTFLRRAAMMGAVIIAWAFIVTSVVVIVTGARALSAFSDTPAVEQPLINTDEPMLPTIPYPCDPDVEVC